MSRHFFDMKDFTFMFEDSIPSKFMFSKQMEERSDVQSLRRTSKCGTLVPSSGGFKNDTRRNAAHPDSKTTSPSPPV